MKTCCSTLLILLAISLQVFGQTPESSAAAEKRRMEIPLENDVLRFPDTP
jgi:hypothetical protein